MSFTADWLALRAEADTRARSPRIGQALADWAAGRPGMSVLDIGAGTGANLRATAPLLPRPQRWLLVDHDPALLACAGAQDGIEVETRVANLAGGIAPLLEPAPDLVTASAFFDLAGQDWLDRFVADLAGSGAALYAVLSYDGREEWAGSHPQDEAIHAAFLADQRRDKGLGRALGPDAHVALAERLRIAGYRVIEGESDWQLEAPRDTPLIAALAEGKVRGSSLGPKAAEWGAARIRAERVRIGHRDLFAAPAR